MKKYLGLIVASIFLVPLSSVARFGATDTWYSQYVVLFILMLAGLSIYIWQTNRVLSLFTLYCLFSCIFVANQHPRAILMVIQLYLACMGISIISKFDKRAREIILKCIVGIVVLQGILVAFQFLNLDPIFNYAKDPTIDDTVGFSGSHNQIGIFFAMTAPIVLMYAPGLIILNIIGLWGATTTIAMIAFIISICGLSFQSKSKIYILFTIITAIFATLVFFGKFERISKDKLTERYLVAVNSIKSVESGRIITWRDNIGKIITCNHWFGFGIGNFIRISPGSQDYLLTNKLYPTLHHKYEHVHNDFIEGFFELGRIGIFFMVFFVVDLFLKFFYSVKTRILRASFFSILSFLICILGVYGVHNAVSGLFICILYGVFLGEWKDLRNGKYPVVT